MAAAAAARTPASSHGQPAAAAPAPSGFTDSGFAGSTSQSTALASAGLLGIGGYAVASRDDDVNSIDNRSDFSNGAEHPTLVQ